MSEDKKRRLALFLDGTWNVVSDNTNVWRLRALFAPKSLDGCEQHAFYSTGLGTKFGERIRGGMFGSGIDTAITSAYEWLMEVYEPDDEIFIFGFSRGAYTARSLSGLISKSGLLKRGAPLGVNQLFDRYKQSGDETIRDLLKDQANGRSNFTPEEQWMLKFSRPVPIKFIGIFDTVGALGVPFPVWRRLRGTAYPFLNTGLRINNEYAFHAMAIDENREAFKPTLWTNMGATDAPMRPIQRTEQRWFVGAHSNVGGGCYNDRLAQIPYNWLARKAVALGLTFTDQFPAEPDAATAPISDSFSEFLKGWYRIFRLGIRCHRMIDAPPQEEGEGVKIINETIDSSVFSRWRTDPGYRPPTVERWAKKKGVNPAVITTSVRADDPSVQIGD